MKKRFILISTLVLLGIGQLFAQFTFTPEKPMPGDVVKFTYTPPANAFNTSDTIACTAFKWGVYEDEMVFETGMNYKPVVINLKKNGNRFEGKLITDSLTRALTFNFTSGKVKFDKVENNIVLVKGKTDVNDSLGYCIPFYSVSGTECIYSNYFLGTYLLLPNINQLGISNAQKANEYYNRELELYPNQLMKVWPFRVSAMRNSDPDGVKTMVTNELNKLFDGGLKTESDYKFVSILSNTLNLKGLARYFSDQANEKFRESGGLISMGKLYKTYAAEQDLYKKESLADSIIEIFNTLRYEDKSAIAFTTLLPRYVKGTYLISLLQDDRLDDFRTCSVKYNITKETAPYYGSFFCQGLDTLLSHNKFPEYTEKEALGLVAFYKNRLALLEQGKTLPQIPDEEYFTPAKQKVQALASLIEFSSFCARMYKKADNDKKAYSYAKDAISYMKMLPNGYRDAPNVNTQYSLLAEKVLPQNECKADVEKMVTSGAWKPEMVEILKRIYVNEKKTEAGFDEYINSLKKSKIDELKKSLVATLINEPAPAFTLNDLDGNPVSLESLKGKTVILDFWATWCGPCKASFPGMKKLQEYYQSNPNVKILFVNTWERYPTDQEKHDKVQAFITEKKYPFHVLMDTKSKVVADYKVTGIPTKCIIDKNGNLRYRITGGETNEGKLLDEMNTMIESIK